MPESSVALPRTYEAKKAVQRLLNRHKIKWHVVEIARSDRSDKTFARVRLQSGQTVTNEIWISGKEFAEYGGVMRLRDQEEFVAKCIMLQ